LNSIVLVPLAAGAYVKFGAIRRILIVFSPGQARYAQRNMNLRDFRRRGD
jgi:hypothetical protein